MSKKHREERKHGAAPYSLSIARRCVVSLTLVAFTASKQPNLHALSSRLVALAFPPQWLLASYQQELHMAICKVPAAPPSFQAIVWFSVTITVQLSWSLFVGQCLLEQMSSIGISASCYGQCCRDYESDTVTRFLQRLHWNYRNRISQYFVPLLNSTPALVL